MKFQPRRNYYLDSNYNPFIFCLFFFFSWNRPLLIQTGQLRWCCPYRFWCFKNQNVLPLGRRKVNWALLRAKFIPCGECSVQLKACFRRSFGIFEILSLARDAAYFQSAVGNIYIKDCLSSQSIRSKTKNKKKNRTKRNTFFRSAYICFCERRWFATFFFSNFFDWFSFTLQVLIIWIPL